MAGSLCSGRGHRGDELVGAGEGEVFGRVFRRQDLDHQIVLDPHLNHMERTAIAVEAVPALALGDRFDRSRVGGDAQREMGRAVAADPRTRGERAADIPPRSRLAD